MGPRGLSVPVLYHENDEVPLGSRWDRAWTNPCERPLAVTTDSHLLPEDQRHVFEGLKSMPRCLLLLAWLIMAPMAATGAELQFLPASARLDGPNSHQRFLVEEREEELSWIGDRSGEAIFRVTTPRGDSRDRWHGPTGRERIGADRGEGR